MFNGLFSTKSLKSRTLAVITTLSTVNILTENNISIAQENPNFKVRLINIEAPATDVFRYNGTLSNNSNQEKVYNLQSTLPPGWSIAYKTEGTQVTSINLDPNSSKDISIEITPSYTADVKKHIIPIAAISKTDTTTINLESVIKGTYKMEISTQNQILSGDATTGSSKEIFLTIKNTGTLPLEKIELKTQLPSKWESNFDSDNIDRLEPGKSKDIRVTIKVPEKTIAGDYMVSISAKNSNQDAQLSYRLEVKTSLLTGWIGISLIIIAIGFIYALIRKYGRR